MSEETFVRKSLFGGIHRQVAPDSCLDKDFPELMALAKDDETAILYSSTFREFGIPVLDGGSSSIVLRFDPFTGRQLPSSLRDELFSIMENTGIEADVFPIPAEFQGERWWIERNL